MRADGCGLLSAARSVLRSALDSQQVLSKYALNEHTGLAQGSGGMCTKPGRLAWRHLSSQPAFPQTLISVRATGTGPAENTSVGRCCGVLLSFASFIRSWVSFKHGLILSEPLPQVILTPLGSPGGAAACVQPLRSAEAIDKGCPAVQGRGAGEQRDSRGSWTPHTHSPM